MTEFIEIKVESKEGLRLDKYLSEELEEYTRSFLQKQIDNQHKQHQNQ